VVVEAGELHGDGGGAEAAALVAGVEGGGAEEGDGVETGVFVEIAVLVKERHINELGGDFVEGDEDAVAVVVGEGEAEELAVAVDVAGGEAGLVEEVGLGDEGDDESKSGEAG
jgi:hypothetical protein